MSTKSQSKVIVILGPTATGKTKLAVKLAAKFNGEIISADSRQVYRGMDIGTGKDLREYRFKIYPPASAPSASDWRAGDLRFKKSKIKKIPYHLIDVVNPNQKFNVAKYKKLALKAISDIIARGKLPIIVGGTGLYLSALIDNYDIPKVKPNMKLRKKIEKMDIMEKIKLLKKLDPMALKFMDVKNPRRITRALEVCLAGYQFSEMRQKKTPPFNFIVVGIKFPREIINQRIDKRVDERLQEGMVNEVKRLHQNGVSWQRLDDFGLEYRYISRHLRGQYSKEEMVKLLKIAIHQFAKRQMTWFKRDQRINWVKNYQEAEKLTHHFLF